MTQYLSPLFSFIHCIRTSNLHPIIKHIGTECRYCSLSYITVWNKEEGGNVFSIYPKSPVMAVLFFSSHQCSCISALQSRSFSFAGSGRQWRSVGGCLLLRGVHLAQSLRVLPQRSSSDDHKIGVILLPGFDPRTIQAVAIRYTELSRHTSLANIKSKSCLFQFINK
jgi:hypothetical protein